MLIQEPDCGQSFTEFEIVSVESEIYKDNVLSAVYVDSWAQALIIETEDTTFAGKSAKITVNVVQYSVKNAGSLQVDISFEEISSASSSPPTFDTTDFTVEPLTCTIEDDQWSL